MQRGPNDQEKDIEAGYCPCSFDLCKSLSKPGIFMLLLLFGQSSGQVILEEGPNRVRFNHGNDNFFKPAESNLAALCKSKRDTYNKPTGMRMEGKDGAVVPSSCATGTNSGLCISQKMELKEFQTKGHPHQRKLEQARATIDKEDKQLGPKVMGQARKIIPKLNRNQLTVFNELVQKLPKLFKIFNVYKNSKDLNGGNCDEHSAQTAYQILQQKVKTGENVKIQIITLVNSNSKEGIREHVYLQLNNDAVSDTVVNHNAAQVASILDSMSGDVCDSWNNGFFGSAKDSTFYKRDAGWDCISIKTLDVDFSKLMELPEEAQNFMCEQFETMELDLSQGLCRHSATWSKNR